MSAMCSVTSTRSITRARPGSSWPQLAARLVERIPDAYADEDTRIDLGESQGAGCVAEEGTRHRRSFTVGRSTRAGRPGYPKTRNRRWPVMRGTRNIAGQAFHRPVPQPERVPSGAEHAHAIHILWWVAAVTLAVAGKLLSGRLWWRPWGHCWCCKGKGRHSRRDGRLWHDCRICRGHRTTDAHRPQDLEFTCTGRRRGRDERKQRRRPVCLSRASSGCPVPALRSVGRERAEALRRPWPTTSPTAPVPGPAVAAMHGASRGQPR